MEKIEMAKKIVRLLGLKHCNIICRNIGIDNSPELSGCAHTMEEAYEIWRRVWKNGPEEKAAVKRLRVLALQRLEDASTVEEAYEVFRCSTPCEDIRVMADNKLCQFLLKRINSAKTVKEVQELFHRYRNCPFTDTNNSLVGDACIKKLIEFHEEGNLSDLSFLSLD